jgi:hypothetical protein
VYMLNEPAFKGNGPITLSTVSFTDSVSMVFDQASCGPGPFASGSSQISPPPFSLS